MARTYVDDEAVAAFAIALMNNYTLHTFYLWGNPSITSVGWQALSKLLCDTSSVNATFLSNHTLWHMGNEGDGASEIVRSLLHLNDRDDKEEVAMIKILKCHDDFHMLPFFEWEFKVLPLALNWLERASELEMPENFEPNIDKRKLSTIYQFVRGMPVLYVETRLRDIKAAESEMEEEQLLLDHRRRLAQERKASIMRRLGPQ